MSSPSKRIVPLVEGSVPASSAMNVDLPAPLGPIRPVIFPGGTSSETPSTARMPSKWRCTSRALSIGRSGCADIVHLRGVGVALEHASGLWPHALRPEPQEADDQQADRDPLERRDEADLRRDLDRPERELVRDEARHLLETHRDEQRAQDRPEVVAATAHDDSREQDDR